MDSTSVVNKHLYEDTYASHSQYFHKEISGVLYGDAGETVPYTIANDGYVSLALLFCILMSVFTIAKSINFIRFQFRNIFRMPRENSIQMRETAREMNYQVFFWLQNIAMLALITYSLTEAQKGADFIPNDYIMIGVLAATFGTYMIAHEGLYFLVHITYFKRAQRHLFNVSRLFLYALQGALLLPITLLHLYFHLEAKYTLYMTAAVLSYALLMRFYKLYNIFFKKNGSFLQFFLYLCTLEAVPLALLISIVYFLANYLKINI